LTLETVAAAIAANSRFFGDEATTEYLNGLTFTGKAYDKMKQTMEARFFCLLAGTPEFSYLAQYINDPDFPPPMIRETRVFYVLLRGARTPLKKKVLNITLLLFSHSFVKKSFATGDLRDPKVKAKAQYEPGSVDTFLRALFSVFSNHGITYRKDSHFNEKGDFQAYWKDTFAKTQAHREDYGTLPNASTFDDNFVIKRYEAIKKGVLRPLSDYDHHTYILLEDFLQKNMLRGSQEPVSITINDLEHGTMPAESGKRGMRFYRLKASHSGQKGNALSLKNTSTTTTAS